MKKEKWDGGLVFPMRNRKNNWETEFKYFINNLDDDVIVTVVDCHI